MREELKPHHSCSASQCNRCHERREEFAPRAPSGTSAARLAVGWLADCNCEGNAIGVALKGVRYARVRHSLACLSTCRRRRRRPRMSRARVARVALWARARRVCADEDGRAQYAWQYVNA
eukprot:1830895-Pyramimonas_sp.AAC.1